MKNGIEKSDKFLELVGLILKYKKTIIINVLVITISAMIISLLIPNEYTAKASFIAPKKKSGMLGELMGFSSAVSNLQKVLSSRLGNVSEEAYNYLVILQSRTVALRVIEKFDLRKVYKISDKKPFEDVIKELENNVKFNVEDEGNIVISVTDKSPKRAAEIANYYIQLLNEYSIELGNQEAKNNREFIEKRVFQIKDTLKVIEDSLKKFSKVYNVLEMQEQVKQGIFVAAEIKAELELAKIQKDLLAMTYGFNHPLVIQSNFKVEELSKRLKSMKFGEDDIRSALGFLIPFEKIPEISIQYLRLRRDFEIFNKLLEFLYPIYEQAKIEELKNIPVVVVVDKAIPPQKKSYPKRILITVAAFIASFFFSLIYIRIISYFEDIKNNEKRYAIFKYTIIDNLRFKK